MFILYYGMPWVYGRNKRPEAVLGDAEVEAPLELWRNSGGTLGKLRRPKICRCSSAETALGLDVSWLRHIEEHSKAQYIRGWGSL